MRKELAAIAIVVVLTVCLLAVGCAEVKIDQMTLDELIELRTRIDARIREIDDTTERLYEDDDVSVDWLGFVQDDFTWTKPSLKVTNKKSEPVYFEITKLSLNGVQIVMSNQFSIEVGGGFTFLTSTAYNFLIESMEDYAAAGIRSLSDVETVYIEIAFYNSDKFGAKPTKTIKKTIDFSRWR